MSSMPTVKVTPVRGSEWVSAGAAREDVPAPFTIAVQSSEPGRWSGVVLDSKHEFHGRRANLLQTDAECTGEVEIVIEPAEATNDLATGYGVVNHELRAMPG